MIKIVDVNAHLHTPYSFSAFKDIGQAVGMAASEGVKVVGINDFYSMDGYREWDEECSKRRLYPLFNIEFISLNAEDQKAGLRVNDPNNPGRTYLSGKGLAYPVKLSGKEARMLSDVRRESNAQVEKMCAKLNDHLDEVKAGFRIDFRKLTEELTKGLVRERHLAKGLRLEVDSFAKTDADKLGIYERIFSGNPLKAPLNDVAAVENEIRSKLLKAGGAAFVPEDPKAFLPMETVQEIITAAGGIPTYPFLADNAKACRMNIQRIIHHCLEPAVFDGHRSLDVGKMRSVGVKSSDAGRSRRSNHARALAIGRTRSAPGYVLAHLRDKPNAGG